VHKGIWIVGTFFVMYGIATLVGFGAYFLFSPLIMWVAVFTLMPIISALLVYGYLLKQKLSPRASFRESLLLAGVWMLLSFSLDAITYIVVVPCLRHSAPNWCFFHDQSPWIWISYLVLLFSALVAQRAYVRRNNA
jgi:hypothetical protein